MSPNMIGALIGCVVGIMGFLFIRLAASRVESKGVGPEPTKTAGILRTVAWLDLVFFIVAGYFIGPMIVSASPN